MQQLIYASADQIAGRTVGGWGVLHATADLTPQTQQTLLRLASVAVDSTLPQFPSAKDLERRCVRFRLDPVGSEYAVCRSVEAGTDHTGRPGNVVSHCARIAAVEGVRPVDWFFSKGWVSPFGPRQIAETTPPVALPTPTGWDETAAWLRDDPSRTARLSWIVDIGLGLLLDRQRVVLMAPTGAECARWASVLTWLLDTPAAGQIRIRIGEDAGSIAEQLPGRPVVVGLTRDVDAALVGGGPMLDTSWQLDAHQVARTGSWTLPTGQQFPASGSSLLAADLAFVAPQIARAVFDKRDELIARVIERGVGPQSASDKAIFLQAAWLATPGAQPLARVEPIRELLANLDESVRKWPEFVSLARELGEGSTEDAGPGDVYAMVPVPVDPWTIDAGAESDVVRVGLLAAARLGAAGVDLGSLLRDDSIFRDLESRPVEQREALRDVAAALNLPAQEGKLN